MLYLVEGDESASPSFEDIRILAIIASGATLSVFFRGVERASDMEYERRQCEEVTTDE